MRNANGGAPAFKKADAGIAVSGATDAARAAASIVLLTPGLSVIIDSIKESRTIFLRMNSYAIYRIANSLRILLAAPSRIISSMSRVSSQESSG